jgi:DNA invertase Pin-like site-specific DNA recombinase
MGQAKSGIESCVVQQKNAEREIATQKWNADAESVFVDDDFSGAEIKRRPNLQALLQAAQRRAFEVVVVRDLDRLARDAARQTALLVQLADVGVRVWSYTKRDFVQLEGSGYLMTALEGIFAEQERAKAAQRIREGLRFRVRAGRRAGRAPLGYRHIRDANGAALWEINSDGAAVIVRVGETFVERGGSYHATAVAMNQAGVASPGGTTWSPQMVKNVLRNPIYRGEYRHGLNRCVARGGTLVRERAPEAEVLRVAHPELRIWPEALLSKIDEILAGPRRTPWSVVGPRHLASSFLKCGLCGSSLVVSGAKKRNNLSYICDKHRMHGWAACRGIGYRAEHAVDRALLEAVAPFVDGDVAERALGLLKQALEAHARDRSQTAARERLQRDLDAAQRKAKNLTDAIARGGELDPLLAAVREQTDRIASLKIELERLKRSAPVSIDPRRVLAAARQRLADYAKLIRTGGLQARPVVEAVLGGERLVVTPIEVDGAKRWQLAGQISAGFLMHHVVKEASAACPSCAAPRELPCASRPPLPSHRPWTTRAASAECRNPRARDGSEVGCDSPSVTRHSVRGERHSRSVARHSVRGERHSSSGGRP